MLGLVPLIIFPLKYLINKNGLSCVEETAAVQSNLHQHRHGFQHNSAAERYNKSLLFSVGSIPQV